jgi:rhomboid-like protein
MQHAWLIAWRSAHSCAPAGKATTIFSGLSQSVSVFSRSVAPSYSTFFPKPCQSLNPWRSWGFNRSFSVGAASRFKPSSQYRQPVPPRAPSQLAFRKTDLRPQEVRVIFGAKAPPIALANILLKVVNSRRVNGTLDLDPPPKLAQKIAPYPRAWSTALRWLRQQYPIDEDTAIVRRIEREDASQYKPQSGSFGAKLGKDGDVFGVSVLEKLRMANKLKHEQDEKELDQYIAQEQKALEEEHEKKVGGLAVRQENGVEGRPSAFARLVGLDR